MRSLAQLTRRQVLSAIGAASTIGGVPGTAEASPQGPYIDDTGEYLTLGNSRVELSLDREQGALKQLYSKDRDYAFLDEARSGQSLWITSFYRPDTHLFTTSHHATPSVRTEQGGEEAALTFRWETPDLGIADGNDPGAQFDGAVEAGVRLQADDPEARWWLAVTNNDDLAIQRIGFPMVQGIEALSDGNEDAVYLPLSLGRRIPDPTTLDYLPVSEYPTGRGAMQFTAYLDEAEDFGLVAGATDTGGHMKEFGFDEEDGDTIGYISQHLEPFQPGEDVDIPYELTLGVHDGDWMDACDAYREWVETEGWLDGEASRLPDRIHDRGATYIHQSYKRPEAPGDHDETSFEMTEAMVSALRERLGFPIGFRWGGWETKGQYGAGDFWPPYEGVEAFTNVVESLQEQDVQVGPYWNPTFVGPHTDYWHNLTQAEREDLPRTNREGEFLGGVNDIGLTWYKCDITYDDWQAHINDVVNHLLESGIRHINQDGIPWKDDPCWNDAHDHPPGKGGNWFQQGVQDYLRSIHTRSDDVDVNISGEGIADIYLPEMTIALTRDVRGELRGGESIGAGGSAEVVPMFPYTFRDYAMPVNSKGHISTHIDWRDLQRVQAGRSIAWGAQPMFMGPYEPKAKEEDYDEHIVAYYGRIGEAWTGYANRFIARGDMLDRPDIDRGTVHIQNHIYGHDVDFTEDAILGRGWEAEGGDLGILLTNVAPDESRILEIDLDEQPYEVPFEPLVYRVRNGEYHGFEGSAGRLELGPSDVGLVGTVPATDGAQAALRRIEDAQDVDGVYQDVLQEAKRAFDDHAFEEAERLAERAIAATEEPTDSPASATQSDTYGTDRTAAPADPPVGGDGSGFRPGPGVGIAALVGGAGATAYLLKRQMNSDGD